MIVKFNRPSIMGIEHSLDKDPKTGEQKNVESHTLLPGHQEIDAKKWAVLSKHPTVQMLIEDGTIEEMDALGEDPIKGFAKAKPAEAIKMVGETIDLSLLKKWQAASDKRAGVKKAIDERISELTGPIEHRSDDDGEISQEDRVQTKGARLTP